MGRCKEREVNGSVKESKEKKVMLRAYATLAARDHLPITTRKTSEGRAAYRLLGKVNKRLHRS